MHVMVAKAAIHGRPHARSLSRVQAFAGMTLRGRKTHVMVAKAAIHGRSHARLL